MSIPKEYDLGDLVRITAVFRNAAAVMIDPTWVSFKIKDPSGTETEYVYLTDVELVKDSVGNYHIEIDANLVGTWYYRFYSTGSGQAAAEASFRVRKSNFS